MLRHWSKERQKKSLVSTWETWRTSLLCIVGVESVNWLVVSVGTVELQLQIIEQNPNRMEGKTTYWVSLSDWDSGASKRQTGEQNMSVEEKKSSKSLGTKKARRSHALNPLSSNNNQTTSTTQNKTFSPPTTHEIRSKDKPEDFAVVSITTQLSGSFWAKEKFGFSVSC